MQRGVFHLVVVPLARRGAQPQLDISAIFIALKAEVCYRFQPQLETSKKTLQSSLLPLYIDHTLLHCLNERVSRS
jgi:hypothetical protein